MNTTQSVSSVDTRIDLIQSLDFTKIKTSIQSKLGWSSTTANAAEMWYKRFLILKVKYPGQSLVPSALIDEIWHAHILDTIRYQKDCMQIFGRFIHHAPNYGAERDLTNQTEATKMYMRIEFGEDYQFSLGICNDEGGDPLCNVLDVLVESENC